MLSSNCPVLDAHGRVNFNESQYSHDYTSDSKESAPSVMAHPSDDNKRGTRSGAEAVDCDDNGAASSTCTSDDASEGDHGEDIPPPFKELLKKDKTFKSKDELAKIFKSVLKHDFSSKVVFSCGSGVTATVLALAYSLIDNKYNPVIYDGSWSEYGRV